MTDTPSGLQLSLRWTLPGAALLSLPVGAYFHPMLMSFLGLTFQVPWAALAAPIGLLVLITPITSWIALTHIANERINWRTACVAIFNFLILLASAGILFLPLLFLMYKGFVS